MLLHIGLVLAIILGAVAGSAETVPPDVVWEKSVEYAISGDQAKGFECSSATTFTQVFLTERSLDWPVFVHYEMAGSPISHVRMYVNGRKTGKAATFTQAADDDVFLTDSKIRYICIPGPFKIGDSLSYSFRQEFPDINYLPPAVIRNSGRMRKLTVTFQHPADMTVKAESFAPRVPAGFFRESHSDKETKFVFDSLDQVSELPAFAYNDVRAVVLFTLSMDGRPINATTPADFVAWYAGMTSLEPALDSAGVDSLDKEIVPGLSDLDKLALINTWVCREIRYIADMRENHSIFPHAPDDVLRTRYGDCKDRASLTCALARRYGVSVHMGLVSSEFEPSLDCVHHALYNHVICRYRDADSTVYFDPTASFHPFGTLPECIVDHPILVLDAVAPLVDTLRRQDQTPDIRISIAASLDALSAGKAGIELRGDRLAAARSAMTQQTDIPKEQLLSHIVGSNLSRITLRRFTLIGDSGQSMSLTADADLSQFLIASSANWYVPKTPFLVVTPEIAEREQDSLPLYFDSLMYLSMTVRLTAPGTQAEADSCILSGGKGIRFAANMQRSDDTTLTIDYSAVRADKVFSGAAKTDYLDFCRRYLAARTGMFVITEGEE